MVHVRFPAGAINYLAVLVLAATFCRISAAPLNSIPPSSSDPPTSQVFLGTHPNFRPSKLTGNKKALTVGIRYTGFFIPDEKGIRWNKEVNGSINDAHNMRKFLIDHHGFKENDIRTVTDEPNNPHQPTRQGIIDGINWLVKDAKPDDSLVFHYSGHGGNLTDTDGDEPDKQDERIIPTDFKKAGNLTDDDFHELMVKPLPAGCRLTAVFDTCHSGTVLDLPFKYVNGSFKGNQITDKFIRQRATPAEVILYAATNDTGGSSEDKAPFKLPFKQPTGAMTSAFIWALKSNPNQTHTQLLGSIRSMIAKDYNQTAELSSSYAIDNSTRFML